VLIAALVACYSRCLAPVDAAQVPAAEGSAEFQLFRNAMNDIVIRCIYRLTEKDVLAGALKSLQAELGSKAGSIIPPGLESKTDEELWVIYKDSLLKLSRSVEPRQSLKNLVELSLRAYCQTLDGYSYYEDYETARKREEFQNPDYVGVGMTLFDGRGEDVICVPFRGGPADRAGIEEGDRLIAVNEHATRGVPLVQINIWVAETQASPVKLRLRRRNGAEETVNVPKEAVPSTPVSMEEIDDGVHITVRGMSERAVTELRDLLRSIGPARSITLDLQGCSGGVLEFAQAVASMFLPPNTVIGKLETLKGTETLHSNERTPYRPARLTILQDRFTASGAELIIAALLAYPPLKAESYGEKTYGKGVTQRRAKVGGKNAKGETVVQAGILTITDSRIYGPNDEFWDKTGLPPSGGDKGAP
jgi:carboxyl-terminal processing protease